VWAKNSVPIKADDFQVEQVWYKSKDGTKVPMFLFSKKGTQKNGNNPVLLTAYGGFDVSLTPSFSQQAVVFAEHGGIVAIPNLRGGGEFGENWHKAGMLDKKQNVFDDFEAAAECLIASKYTAPDKLSILGGSNGGLLVGAALTHRPELYRAMVCLYCTSSKTCCASRSSWMGPTGWRNTEAPMICSRFRTFTLIRPITT
jgi:prolyl oligopeptidase